MKKMTNMAADKKNETSETKSPQTVSLMKEDGKENDCRDGNSKSGTDGKVAETLSFDVEDVCDLKLDFDDDDIVEYHPNSILTEKKILPNGEVDVYGCFQLFTLDGTKPLLTGSHLAEKLNGKVDPFAKRGGIENPGNLLFASYLWDIVLKTQFLGEKTPCLLIEKICKTFTPEMKEYSREADLSLFGEYVDFINSCEAENPEKTNLTKSTSNWFDVPAILRMLAPLYESLVDTDYNPLKFYCSTTMKGLPHGVIMMPWYAYQLENRIPGVENNKEVSTHLLSEFSCYTLTNRF